MNPNFSVTIKSLQTAPELPSTWPTSDCLALLKQLEFDGATELPEDQLREYATMALQDLEPEEAAKELIEFIIGERLNSGRKQNIYQEMPTEPLWEEYPDLSCHEPIFNAQFLLNQAFPETPTPEVNKVELIIRPLDQAAEAHLKEIAADPKPEPFITRCIAAAQPEDSILNRLFEDQIAGADFAEAEHIVWHIQSQPAPAEGKSKAGLSLNLYSPIRWTESLEEDTSIDCTPYLDTED